MKDSWIPKKSSRVHIDDMNDADSNSGNAATGSSSVNKKHAASSQEALKRFMKIVNSFLVRPDSGPFREPVDWRGLELYDYPEIIKKQMDLGTVKRKLERKQYPCAAHAAYDVRLVWKNCMLYNTEGSDFWILAKSYNKRFEDRYRRIRNEFYVGDDPVYSDDEVEADEQSPDEVDEDEVEEDPDDSTHNIIPTTSARIIDDEDNDDDEEEEFDGSSVASGSGGGAAATHRSSPASVETKKQRVHGGPPSSSPLSAPGTVPKMDARAKLASNLFLLSGVHLGHVLQILETKCPQALEGEAPQPKLPDKIEIVIDKIEPPEVFALVSSYAAEHAVVRKRPNPNPKMKDVSNRRKDRK